MYVIFEATIFMTVIPFRVSQLTYLQGQTLEVMEILFSTFWAGFATNVPSDERLLVP
jgi:hypothetical protein